MTVSLQKIALWGMTGAIVLPLLHWVPGHTIAPVYAQNSSPQVNCQNPTGTPEINYCAELAYQASDKSLNQVYQSLRAKVSETETNKLVKAQRDWIRYRNANCQFAVRLSEGGTGYEAYLNECLERITKQRTGQLQKQVESRSL